MVDVRDKPTPGHLPATVTETSGTDDPPSNPPPVTTGGAPSAENWNRFRARAPQVSTDFFEQPAFTELHDRVQLSLKALLGLRPDRADDVQRLIEDEAFSSLPEQAQRAVFKSGKPEELDHILTVLGHETWPELDDPKHDLLYLDQGVQLSILDQSNHYYDPHTDQYLLKMIRTEWFLGMDAPDQLRATKLIALLSSKLEDATFEEEGVSQREIVEATLDALFPPSGTMAIRFEDLPLENGVGMTGYPEFPSTVVLNRNAVTADDQLAGHREGGNVEAWVALKTVPHEVTHLRYPTDPEPTYEAFMDEYRAWFNAWVVAHESFPPKSEALAWIENLLTEPRYAYIAEAARTPGPREEIEVFLGNFSREPEDLKRPAPPPTAYA